MIPPGTSDTVHVSQQLAAEDSAVHQQAEIDYNREVWRKLLHLLALSIPIGYQFAGRGVAFAVVFACFLVSLLIDLARFRGWSIQRIWYPVVAPIVRPRESRNFTGATFILASGWLCPLLFSLPAATVAMLTIILGDTFAALIGRRWGRHRTIGSRSVEGSLAFLAVSFVAVACTPNLPLAIGLTAAPLAAAVEMFSTRIDDNLSVPLIVGLYAHLALRIFQ